MPDPSEITLLLGQWSDGDADAFEKLFPLVYNEMRCMAASLLSGERSEHTLQPTALVHEAYVRLVGPTRTGWSGRSHFLSMASIVMRRILVDHARRHLAGKRIGRNKISIEQMGEASWEPNEELVSLDLALNKLAEIDPRQARVVELRFFGGLKRAEIAEVLGISESTVKREWRMARVWLRSEMEPTIEAP